MKNKKIGILTFHNVYNYGAFLQAYALERYLSKENEVKIINYINPNVIEPYKLIECKNIKTLIKSAILLPINLIKNIKFKLCLKKYCNLTKRMSKQELIKDGLNEYDVLITGSDQVWNTLITKELDDVYTLNFKTKAKKMSYAASLGNGMIDTQFREDFRKKISQIDYVSVREENTREVLEDLLENNKRCSVVVDPTLLLTRDEWETFLKEPKEKEKYILVYAMTKNKKIYEIANKIANKFSCKIIHFTRTNGEYDNDKILSKKIFADPREFVGLIKNAEFVLTNTFHGTVFSIIFNKRFLSILPQNASNRITEILKIFSLEDRGIHEDNQFYEDILERNINYNVINEKIKEKRTMAHGFIELID